MFGGLLGICVFLAVYGCSALDVTNDFFCRGGYLEKDIQQHYAGWLFYRGSDLRFPLCIAQNINFPDGLSVAYTDSIPLFASFFRLLADFLPATFQYFGWFTLLCFFFQGAFGALLLSCFTDSPLIPIFGDLLFVCSPVLLERAIRHTALGAQFLILAELYYYFRSRREDKFAYPGLFLLNVLCIAIHPYWVPMCYSITLAVVAEYAWRHRKLRGPAAFLLGNLCCTVLAGWSMGLFYGSALSGGQALYGYFSLNLNALWNPTGVNGTRWSRFLPPQNQVKGNYDAFAYLGLGVLAALILSLLYFLFSAKKDGWRRLRNRIRSHWMLCAVCVILTAFAVSNVVTANGATLVTLALPERLIRLFSVFRSGGRLFWPVYYLLMLAAILGVLGIAHSVRRRGAAAAAVLILAALQLLDISPGISQHHNAFQEAEQTASFPSQLSGNFWKCASQQYKHILSMDSIQNNALSLALFAADNGMTTNDPFAARYDETALQNQRSEILKNLEMGRLEADTLYLFADEGDFLAVVDQVQSQAWCGHICASDSNGWYVIAPGLQGSEFGTQAVPFNENYPLKIADYTDALWNHGVLSSDKRIVCFRDSAFVRRKLSDAAALGADGTLFSIVKTDDKDAGWLMVTLETEDASCLIGQELEIVKK